MNLSMQAFVETLAASLRTSVLPHVTDAYARTQLFGALDMLANLSRMADWSAATLATLAELQEEACCEIEAMGAEAAPALPPRPAPLPLSTLRQRLDAGADWVIAVIGWAERLQGTPDEDVAQRVQRRVMALLRAQNDVQRALVAPPMLAEMAGSSEAPGP